MTFQTVADKLLNKAEMDQDPEMFAFCRASLHLAEQMEIISKTKMWSQVNKLAENTINEVNTIAEKIGEKL